MIKIHAICNSSLSILSIIRTGVQKFLTDRTILQLSATYCLILKFVLDVFIFLKIHKHLELSYSCPFDHLLYKIAFVPVNMRN